jgi:general nucleoside transport system permease protein
MTRTETVLVPLGAMVAGLLVFGIFCAALGVNPLLVYASIYKAGFGSWYSWQNTLVRASPLLLTGLCTAIPARAGIIVIGNEGAVVLGGLGAIIGGLATLSFPPFFSLGVMLLSAMLCGGAWIAFSVALQHYRGVSSVISGLLLSYLAIALMNQLLEGPLRDPSSLDNPASYPLTPDHRLSYFSGTHVHHGLIFGLIACLLAWFLIERTTLGFAIKISGGNVRAAQLSGLPVGRLVVIAGFLGGACAGVAGMVEVAAVHGRANESLNAGYGYVGILVAFLSRQSPLGVVLISLLVGGLVASSGMLQRAHDLPDAAISVLQGILFISILLSDTMYGRFRLPRALPRETKTDAVAA